MNSVSFDRKYVLIMVLLLTSVYFAVQIITGLAIGSLALISDAGHMLIDVCGLVMALIAISFSQKPSTPNRTYGFYRSEILASLLNSMFLILLSFYILYEAYHRIFSPLDVNGYSILLVASIGLGVNIVSIMLLRPQVELQTSNGNPNNNDGNIQEKNLNLYGAHLEIFADTIGSVGVIIAEVIKYPLKIIKKIRSLIPNYCVVIPQRFFELILL